MWQTFISVPQGPLRPSGSGSLMTLHLSCWPALQSLRTQLGLKDPLKGHPHSCLTSMPHVLLHRAGHDWTSPSESNLKERLKDYDIIHVREGKSNQNGGCGNCLNLISDRMYYHFCWSHRPALVQCERGLHKGVDTKGQESSQAISKDGCHSNQRLFGSCVL